MKFVLFIALLLTSGGSSRFQTTAPHVVKDADGPRFLRRLSAREDFDRLARVAYEGRFTALPHVMFVVDRAAAADERVYYINSKKYFFHPEFLNANYLTLERGRAFYRRNYLAADRRFILGTIAYQVRAEKFTFELWEGDLATAGILREAYDALHASFFAPLFFKPNSAHQLEASKEIPGILSSELDSPGDYAPLNRAVGVGVLRILDQITDETIIDRNEIVILREPPLRLTPLIGLITTSFSTPLSHVNLLAKGWGVPNAYIKDADRRFQSLDGRYVYFETRDDGFILRPAESNETLEAGRRLAARSDLLTPDADLEFKQLVPLALQRKNDAKRFGAKSANLGEVLHASLGGRVHAISVPAGFSIPFFYYTQFLEENGLDRAVLEMLGDDRFNHDAVYRKRRLTELRLKIESGKLNPAFLQQVIKIKKARLGANGVFVRSSTNSEDLPNFSGAGLYTTVPNVRDDRALGDAIRKVWASLWNYEAYEAREAFGINHAAVYPAVLIQLGVNADAAGVMISTDPFDRDDRDAVYINAKRGLGIKVVEGRGVPEQLLFSPRTRQIRTLTRSEDDSMLTFDPQGGVRRQEVERGRIVLNNQTAQRLAQAALEIKQVFDGRDQDIEWLVLRRRIFIVQSRPFIEPEN
jgi:hypothetical protein